MFYLNPTVSHALAALCFVFVCASLPAQQSLYWVNGPGDWDDPAHWSFSSGGPGNSVGVIPTKTEIAVIDIKSRLRPGDVVRLPPGIYEVLDLTVDVDNTFTLAFDGGINGAPSVAMEVYRDLLLDKAMTVTYAGQFSFSNQWKFLGANTHRIFTATNDLNSVQLLDEDATYVQLDNLTASKLIQLYGGTWTTNGYDVTSDHLIFRDDEPSSSPLTKTFNTGGSEIRVDEWASRFTYGSLTVNGRHDIYTSRFDGSPIQLNGPAFSFDAIHLLEFPDLPPGGSGVIEHNNFDCSSCLINKLIIEDTGKSQLAGKFTIEQEFTVINNGLTIAFNGGNGRTSEVTFNGTINLPTLGRCGERTILTNIYNDFSTFLTDEAQVIFPNAIVENIHAGMGGTLRISNGELRGDSPNWSITNPPAAQDYQWVGNPNNSVADWDDPANWQLVGGGSTGCLPQAIDNVFINKFARSNINIPAGFTAMCNDFIWANDKGLVLTLNGLLNVPSTLTVGGNFSLHASASIIGNERHGLSFSSITPNTILTEDVVLPKISFSGALAEWRLQSDLTAESIGVIDGTLLTRGQDVTTDTWWSDDGARYYFSNSTLTVNGQFTLAEYNYSDVFVDPGTSTVICERLVNGQRNLYDVKLINTTPVVMENFQPQAYHSLTLDGAGPVTFLDSLTVGNLIFGVGGSGLIIDPNAGLVVTGSIESRAPAGNPAILRSRVSGNAGPIHKPAGHLCATGPIAFEDVNSTVAGVFHAPEGVDAGNTSGIDFTGGSGGSILHWIGATGDWANRENWSGLSGGCPAGLAPGRANQLIFDANSFVDDGDVVTVAGNVSVNEIQFTNDNFRPELNILDRLTAVRVQFSLGQVELTGEAFHVQNDISLINSSLLITFAKDLRAATIDTESSLMIIRLNANVRLTGD